MTDKELNLFDKCAAICVHLFLQEEECTSSPWGDSKTYAFGIIANSQRILSGAITKIRIWVEGDTVKH